MEIVFYVILYAIIGGISAGVFLYFKNKRSRYENRYDIDTKTDMTLMMFI